jgi:hypothetical protein
MTMPATILVHRTYETWTYEDVETGDTDDRGFDYEDVPHTFRELVDLMRCHHIASDYPTIDGRTWFSEEEECFRTGDRTTYSIHLATPDNARAVRYWIKAARTVAARR